MHDHNQSPAFARLVESYILARRSWTGSAQVRRVANVFKLSERAYCDQYVLLENRDPQTRKPYAFMRELKLADRDAAFEAAGKEASCGPF